MQYKKVFWGSIISISIAIIGIFVATMLIDPLGIIGTPIIKGFNNYKVKQDSFMDVWKPYDLHNNKFEIIYIGTSRVYIGMKPTTIGYTDNKVYNLGFSGLSLNNAEEYLNTLYIIHKPEKIYIGLDFFQFDVVKFLDTRSSFSETRLMAATKSDNAVLIEKLKDNFQLASILKDTVKESKKNKDLYSVFVRGWYKKFGEGTTDTKSYYITTNRYIGTFVNWEYDDRAMACFQRIVEKAKDNGVKVYVFFNPVNIDMQTLINITDHENDLNDIKRQVTKIVGTVYDFNFTNDYTMNRSLYRDPSHYLSSMGELMKQDMNGNVDTERLMILNKNTIENDLKKQNKALERWMKNNKEYVEFLQSKIKNNDRVRDGELKPYIGI